MLTRMGKISQALGLPYAVTSCYGDPSHKIIFIATFYNCHFATVMNHNVNIHVFRWSQVTPMKSHLVPKGVVTHRLRTTALEGAGHGD